MSWACDLVAEILLILKKTIYQIWTAHDFVWDQSVSEPVSVTGSRMELPSAIVALGTIQPEDIGDVWKAMIFQHCSA